MSRPLPEIVANTNDQPADFAEARIWLGIARKQLKESKDSIIKAVSRSAALDAQLKESNIKLRAAEVTLERERKLVDTLVVVLRDLNS